MFHSHWSPKYNPEQLPISLFADLEHYQQSAPLLAYKLHKKLHPIAVTHRTLKHPFPLEFNQTTPNLYQLIALCLCNRMTPS